MSKIIIKEKIQNQKEEMINTLSVFLDSLIESQDTIKKASLISYWLSDFQKYISQEADFEATKLKSYRRGDVIKVNLGFNVGSEQGGLRYAVVLDKHNTHNSKTITVIPLTSKKEEKTIYKRDVDLGCELYNRVKAQYDSLKTELDKKKAVYIENKNKANSLITSLTELYESETIEKQIIDGALLSAKEMAKSVEESLSLLAPDEQSLLKIQKELMRMKDGSIAKVEQITTISKQRIYTPRKNTDVLAGVKFSDTAMDKINEKIKELYIF